MSQPTRKLAAIMFTDIVGFTDLTATDEAIALKLLQWQRETFQPLIAEHGGEWLKEIGDGLLLSFASSQDAVRCAIRIQDAVGEVPNLKLRIGIHQGDIVQEGADILGDGVNMASRIEAVAPAGGIAFSEKVQQDIAGYPEFETVSLGEYSLKGVSRPVILYCLAPYGLPNIPEYKLLCRTGAGAYGEVWLAQTHTGIYRAVKIVRRSQFEDERPYEREFKGITEYEPVSRKSDGLIDLLHVGRSETDDFFYYVMELADGQRPSAEINVASYQPKTLESELESRGRLTIEECLKHGSHLARALAFLHSQNLVHRDIKPANIVFVNGQPKLADIGLVTTMDNASTLVGTMGYIPPEGPGKPSSDIYALGMVLYELGTGKDRADFPEIDVMDPALKGLNQVCLKACSNDLRERFSDANALADELDRLAHEPLGGTTAASPSGSYYKVAALAASLILILVLALSRDPEPPTGPGPDDETNIADEGDPTGETSGTVDLSDGLVAYYPFDGNASDMSGNGHDGTATNVEFVEGGFGPGRKAGKFGNGSRVVVSARDFPAGNAPRTLSCFVKVLDHPGGTDPNIETYICGYGSQRANAAFALYGDTFNEPSSATSNGWFSWSQWGGGIGVSAENEAELGKWYMLTVTYDGATVKTYLDGEFYQSKLFTLSTDISAPFNIGQWDLRRYTIGLIDEVRLYNRALSPDEVAKLYSLEKPKPVAEALTKGLVAHYPLDGNASDMSGNGHHGEMKGGAFAEDRHGNPSACKEGGAIVLPQSLAGQFGGDAPITVSVWAQHAAAPRNQALFGIGSNRIRRSFGLYSEEGKLCFSRWEDRFPTDYIFPEGQWAHCLVTHEGTTLKIYVNGKEVLSNEIQVDRLIGEAVLGASPFSAWRDSFRGSLDDVRIYNRALPPEEVKQLYEFEKLRK